MRTKIGIDFDNTIASYDGVFKYISAKFLRNIKINKFNKENFKKEILRFGGLSKWKKIQSLVYGKYINLAKIFPGFLEFLVLSKFRKNEIYIVSHKTKYGYFGGRRFLLRNKSLNWIKSKLIFKGNEFLKKENIFFESKKRDKIRKIDNLKCGYFIDDLKNIFFHNNFPRNTKKILFSQNTKNKIKNLKSLNSWREIGFFFYKSWTTKEITKAVNIFFFNNQAIKSQVIKGRGNSRIFKIFLKNKKKCCLKIYPDKQIDTRERQNTEYKSTNYLHKKNFPVAKPILKNEDLNWSIFKWEEGKKISKPDIFFVDYSINFVKKLKKISLSLKHSNFFQLSTEGCLNGAEIERQINNRMKILKVQNNRKLNIFFRDSYYPLFIFFLNRAKRNLGSYFYKPLSRRYQILNPTDFGSHNGIKVSNKKIVFIDFEYFGWDDPVRLLGDYYWHPGMNLKKNLKQRWLSSGTSIFANDSYFKERLTNYLPLLGLRWCLIVLNEFIKDRLQKRIDANVKKTNKQLILKEQFEKAKKLLLQIDHLKYSNII